MGKTTLILIAIFLTACEPDGGTQTTARLAEPEPQPETKVVHVFGDTIGATPGGYAYIVANAIGATVVNRATITGATIFSTDICEGNFGHPNKTTDEWIEAIEPGDLVLYVVGANEGRHYVNYPRQVFYNCVKSFTGRVHAAGGVLFIAAPPLNLILLNPVIPKLQDDVNTAVQNLGTVVDLEIDPADGAGTWPTANGHQAIADQFLEVIQ